MAQRIQEKLQARLDRYLPCAEKPELNFAPAEALLAATGADIRVGGQQACYVYNKDYIRLPSKRHFESSAEYYETAFHELVHWAHHHLKPTAKEKEEYAFNELVAEIGACYLCFEIGVPHAEKMLENSCGYVEAWLKEMGNNPKYIFDSASQASKSVSYLLGLTEKKKVA
jgi:antirestriction protein ArdC